MKVAVSSTGPDIGSQVDPRFGRCKYFIVADTDSMDFESVENPNVMAMGGAGIQSAQLIANKGVEAVLTGNCGPNAFRTLAAAGVKVVTGVNGIIKEAVEGFKSGKFQATSQPSVAAKFGAGAGQDSSPIPDVQVNPQENIPPEQDVQLLKSQADALKKQLEEITKRIDQIGEKTG